MNIVQPILYHCKANPTEAALIVPGNVLDVMSYAGLERSMNSIGRKALALGLTRGGVATLWIENAMLHTITILALARLGVVTLSMSSLDVPQVLKVDAFITDKGLSIQNSRTIRLDPRWLAEDGEPIEDARVHMARPDDRCRVILTSGTTGESKAVAVTHGMLRRRIARHQFILGNRFPFCSRICVHLGLHTSMGFQALLAILWRGGTALMPGPHIPATLNAIELCRIQGIMTTPGVLLNMVRAYDERVPSLPRLEAIFSGGSMIPPALAEQVQAGLCSNLINFYGSTETSMVASAPLRILAKTRGAAGYVLPGATVEIVDHNDSTLAPNQEGMVRIRGNCNVSGYLGISEQSSGVFRGEWFYPGDTGFLTADNLLVLTGRQNTVINLSGNKVKPEMIEEVLMAHPTVAQAGAFTVVGPSGLAELWAAVVPRDSTDVDMLKTYCQKNLPSMFVPANLMIVSELPRNAMGKVERLRLPELAKRRMH